MIMKTVKKAFLCAVSLCIALQAFACGRNEPEEGSLPATGSASESQADSTVPVTAPQEPPTVTSLKLPEDNKKRSDEFALRFLSICAGYSKTACRELVEAEGFEVVLQKNFEKSDDDRSHTSAFTVGRGTIEFRGKTRDMVIITVRGTKTGEWYSNFDIVPSRSDQAQFAENFLAAAQDVYDTVKPVLDSADNPVILVGGHSRGAATSNLLGYLLDGKYDNDALYVYTYATPTTARSSGDYPYIFNYLNPADVVTLLPPPYMGFVRLGTDIILEGDSETAGSLDSLIKAFEDVAPTVSAYYDTKYSIFRAGIDEEYGMTTYEVMLVLCDVLCSNDASAFAPFALMSQESSFYTLASALISSGITSSGSEIVKQHTPTLYGELIKKLITDHS